MTELESLSPDNVAMLDVVERSLSTAREMREWWDRTEASNSYANRFELVRSFNRPDESFGFFDQASVGGHMLPVMGDVQDMLYDRPKGKAVDWREQVREFVLHYFMRISDFRQPEAYAETPSTTQDSCFGPLTWCPPSRPNIRGFGYQQLFYKLRRDGSIGQFAEDERYAIVDLKEFGEKYEWVVMKVRLLDFRLTFAPLGPDRAEIDLPLKEETILVVSGDFLVDEENPEAGVLGQYGFGYALMDQPTEGGPLVYGPGKFGAGFQFIHFRVLQDGDTRVRMGFIVNRPTQILNISLDPVEAGLEAADFISGGFTSQLMAPIRNMIERVSPKFGRFDPVLTYISWFNFVTNGWAAERLCISKEQLEKKMLVQHFMRHYEMIAGSLVTWRQIPDWLDAPALPGWVIHGVSA
jgi:hypothetical protein